MPDTIEHLDRLAERRLSERNYEQAQEAAWRQLDINPLHGPAVRQLMTALARSGQRSAAMAQYEIYRKRLEQAAGAEPSPELTELYTRIQNDELQQTMLRHPAKLPADTSTINPIFCYTDIESSTRLWDEHRETMLWALRQHNDICETEIESYDGRILHPTGDGFLIVFEQNDPLAFAISLQQQFARADWGEIGELRIRIGFHGATADQEGHEFFHDDGGWYRGPVLNHAARIADTGHGGQIVASDMVKEHCPLPPGASWEDLGAHNLKSLDEAYQIYGLLHPDLAIQDFPALRTPANKKKAAQVGAHIRGYELGQMIGQGAFGEVYQAQQPGVGRPVAVKKIRSRFANQPDFIRRFEAEAQVVARLEHPHIVPLYDYWREADGAFLVMRFMRGGSLKGLLEFGALDLDTTLSLIDQVGSALAFAHQQGFVHRDIKPANILLDESGNGYLSDFGIVKDLSLDADEAPSASVTGTPAYLSPEQVLSQGVSPLSDQYSLGVMLYEMLTGTKPFDDTSSPSALLAKQVEEPLPLVSTTHPALPPAVDEVIQRATAKDANARYDDIVAMVRALHIAAQKDGRGLALPEDFVQLEEELVNPFKGLRSFQEADAVNFFGRSALVKQLLARFETVSKSSEIPSGRFLAVVGPSGSGKSSVVKAGLLPALRRGAVPGSEKWFMVEMIPGTHPLEELEAALLRIAIDPPDSLLEQLRQDERGLTRVLEQLLPGGGGELLLLIDQFEELFTMVEEDERRNHFINSLLAALHDPHSRLRVAITVRADFYDRPLMTPGLAELMRHCTEIVPPLNKTELEEVIVQPALQVGTIFEDGLVPVIIDDVSEQPGALPLLQYALTELFERRQERLLTQDAYAEIGGVLGALARRAEELYTELDEEGEEAARQLFMRLVTLGEGTEDTRRRVLRSELTALQTSEVLRTSEVLDAYGRYRLLTFDHDPLTREPTVEVAHEALLRDWPRLRRWLDESRDDVRLQRRLSAAAAEWLHADKSDDYLLRGSRLDLFIGWFAATRLALTQEEQAFLDASEAARQQHQAEEEARRQRELETAQQLAREQQQRAEEQEAAAHDLRRRALFLGAALVIAAILAIAAIFFANQSNTNAQTAVTESNQRATAQAIAEAEAESRATAEAVAIAERDTAEEQTQLSTSREIALAALNNLDADPELSILLALEALNVRPTNEAQEALHRALQESRVRIKVRPYEENSIVGAAFSPDGTRFVTTDTAGTAIVWDGETGAELARFDGHAEDGTDEFANVNWVMSPDFTPDGQKVATGGEDGTVRLWDPNTAEELLVIEAHEDGSSVEAVDFSADGSKLLTGGWDNAAKIWDTETGNQLLAIEAGHSEEERGGGFTGVIGAAFSPDSSRFATSGVDGLAIVWDAESGEELLRLDGHHDGVPGVAFSPDGSLIATASWDNTAKIWDAETGELIDTLSGHSNELRKLAFSPDSQRLATASADGTAKIWEMETGRELMTLAGHNNRVFDIAFSPDGSQVLTTSRDWTARVWNAGQGQEEKLTNFIAAHEARYSPDGQQVVTTDDEGVAKIWDAESGEELMQFQGTDWSGGAELSPDGTILAQVFDDGTAIVWDAQSGESLYTLAGHEDWVNNLAISPDGTVLATAGQDGKIILWNLDSGQEMMALDHGGPAWGVSFTPDGAFFVSAGADEQEVGTAFIWDLTTGERLQAFEGHNQTIKRSFFSPDGTKLLTAGWDATARLWDVASGEELFLLGDHSGPVWGASYSPDGSMVATGSIDGSIKLWDANTGVALLTLVEGLDGINNVAFSPDGTSLIAAVGDGTLREYILPLEELVELARTRLTRTLTDEECRQYLHLDACPVED